MTLTKEQIAHFYREGYVLAPGLVPRDEVTAVRAAADAFQTEGEGWNATVFEHHHPQKDAAIHRLLVEPHVVEAVRDIFEAEPLVYYGMLAVVPARGGNGLPWHQDNMYDTILGGALNVFIALCDITPDKAILWVAPRSHLSGVLPSQGSEYYNGGHREAVVEPENGMPLPAMQAGDTCIFDRNTLHRSFKNGTDEPRYAYAAQFMAEHARRADSGAKDPLRMKATELQQVWQCEGALR